MTPEEIAAGARAYLGPRHESIPQDVYDTALARLIFVTTQHRRGLRLRDGHWKRVTPESEAAYAKRKGYAP
jgi:hypothetical protein